MVEAAVVMPIFLAILLISMYLMVLSFKVLRFQYEISDIARQTFLLTPSQRASVAGAAGIPMSWRAFLDAQIDGKLSAIGFSSSLQKLRPNNYNVQFSPARLGCVAWDCAASAMPGDVFSITITLNEPMFGATLAGLSWQVLSIDTKVIAFVSRPQNEEE